MGTMNFIKRSSLIPMIVIFLILALTFTSSAARLAFRHEYKLSLSMMEHFDFPAGKSHLFIVPHDGYYAFKLWGADGGDSLVTWPGWQESYQIGGQGGGIAAVSYFPKDTVLIISVGERGQTTAGGFNGGGSGGSTWQFFVNFYGGGGGGATDVRLASDTLDDRILVAGGGGGGSGGDSSEFYPSYGGNGGTLSGELWGSDGDGIGFGFGGTTSSGGDGAFKGNLGYGGDANYSGGGGGGGYYGGGGAYGSGGGGGGGSSYIGSDFSPGVPLGLPDMEDYVTDHRDGYAIISFLGNRYINSETEDVQLPIRIKENHPSQTIEPEAEELPPASDESYDDPEHEHGHEPDPDPDPNTEPSPGSAIEPELKPNPEHERESEPESAPDTEPKKSFSNAALISVIKAGTNPKNIEKCLKTGVLPTCFENNMISLEVQIPRALDVLQDLRRKK